MEKKITLEDIARKAGVSKNTVSVVLRGKPGVSDAVRKQILDLSVSMGYTKSAATESNYILALISDTLSGHVSISTTGLMPRLYFGLQNACQEHNYILITYTLTREIIRNKALPSVLNDISFKGIVTFGRIETDYMQILLGSGVHVVMAHEYIPGIPVDSVMSDEVNAGYVMTEYLIKLGHKDIAYFGEKYYLTKYAERWAGYCLAMVKYGLPIMSNSYSELAVTSQTDEQEAIYLNKAFDEIKTLPTAVVCGEDFTATRIKRVLSERGIRFPEDISIVGFDDVYQHETDLKITTYRVDDKAIVMNILDLIKAHSKTARRIIVNGTPVYRNSAIKLKK